MIYVAHAILCLAGIAIALIIVRRQGLLSLAGLTVATPTAYMVFDALHLYTSNWNGTLLTPYPLEAEVALRLKGALFQNIGFVAFAVGLLFFRDDADARSRVQATPDKALKHTAQFCLAVGIAAHLASYMTEGIFSFREMIVQMYEFSWRTKRFEFLTFGYDMAFIGFGLLACAAKTEVRRILLLTGAVTFGVALTASKSGMHSALLSFYVALAWYRPHVLKRWLSPPVLAMLGALFIAAVGVKSQVKYRDLSARREIDYSVSGVGNIALETVGARFSSIGVFRGYCTLVDRLSENPSWHGSGQALRFGLISWVPRFMWPEKPITPTKGLGYLVDAQGRINDESSDSLTLVGMCYWDFGLAGVLFIMPLVGAMLGLLNRFFVGRRLFLLAPPGFIYLQVLGDYMGGYTSVSANILFLMVLTLSSWWMLSLTESRVRRKDPSRTSHAF